jgi:hypothetical protein
VETTFCMCTKYLKKYAACKKIDVINSASYFISFHAFTIFPNFS